MDSFELTPFFCFSVDGENDAFQKNADYAFSYCYQRSSTGHKENELDVKKVSNIYWFIT